MKTTHNSMIIIQDYKDAHPHISQLTKLDQLEMKYSWSEKDWHLFLKSNKYCLLLCTAGNDDSKILSFCLLKLCPLESLMHLLKIVVSSNERGNGLGHQLISTAFSQLETTNLDKIFLEVEVGNDAAVALYLKNGFIQIHQKKSFYSDSSDAFVMERHLKNLSSI
jgi:ribosomal-protein-alanine N-acetyltransferase